MLDAAAPGNVEVWQCYLHEREGDDVRWNLLFGALVAISFTVPIFLLNRERALAAREPSSAAGPSGRST